MNKRFVYDTETKNLLNSNSIDYNASPYKLKDPEFLHCAGFVSLDSEFEIMFGPAEIRKKKHIDFIMEEVDEMIGHNIINFDNLVLKMNDGLDYSIGCSQLGIPDTVTYKGKTKNVIITDTLVMSKTLNPDRPQHSIAYFGSILGLEKIDWRAKAIELGLIEATSPKGEEFRTWHPEMGIYMMRDCHVNKRVHSWLVKEWGDWNWTSAYELEKAVAEIITRQEHRGFWFDRDKAVLLVKDLDEKMEELRVKVEPLIPPKPLTQGDLANMTPVEKQFKKNGEPTTHILNFAKKHGGEFKEIDGVWQGELYGKLHTLPMPHEPLFTHKPAKLDDTLHIKEWLVGLGWSATSFKERDLTVDSKKKKITKEKFDIAVEKWVEQTFASPFKHDRIDNLDRIPSRISKERLIQKLQEHDHMKRPLKVYTNPTICVGSEKEIDPNLLKLADKFPYAQEVSEYLTYKHRRNSILGGGVDPDDDDDMQKGWMSVERVNEDHRIPTPADTCGAGTSRFKHRICANIPRVSSLYGANMRSLFGADVAAGMLQIGADIDSLEACIEAHYCWRYEDDLKDYCKSLTLSKPNDVHSKTALKISEVIGRPFNRTPAKSVKYCCAYGGQPKRVAKTIGCDEQLGKEIFDAYWLSAMPLKLLADKLKVYWEYTGNKKFILGVDGRKIPTRSASALINSLFQSAGVICAKRAMVIHDRALKHEGLSIDFFTEDWKQAIAEGREICQQLIAYHK